MNTPDLSNSGQQDVEQHLVLLNVLMHEMRSPLVTLRGYIEMMLRGRLGPITPLQEKSMQVALRNTSNLEDQIGMILNHARLERQRCVLNRKPASLQRIVERSFRFFDALAEQKKLSLLLESPNNSNDLLVDADPEHLERILRILLDNAIKFTDTGHVTLRITEPDTNTLRFAVIDTGPGIDAEHHEQIFEPFVKLNTHFKGAGLGLSVAQGLVNLHNTTLHLDSALLEGTTLWFDLPQA